MKKNKLTILGIIPLLCACDNTQVFLNFYEQTAKFYIEDMQSNRHAYDIKNEDTLTTYIVDYRELYNLKKSFKNNSLYPTIGKYRCLNSLEKTNKETTNENTKTTSNETTKVFGFESANKDSIYNSFGVTNTHLTKHTNSWGYEITTINNISDSNVINSHSTETIGYTFTKAEYKDNEGSLIATSTSVKVKRSTTLTSKSKSEEGQFSKDIINETTSFVVELETVTREEETYKFLSVDESSVKSNGYEERDNHSRLYGGELKNTTTTKYCSFCPIDNIVIKETKKESTSTVPSSQDQFKEGPVTSTEKNNNDYELNYFISNETIANTTKESIESSLDSNMESGEEFKMSPVILGHAKLSDDQKVNGKFGRNPISGNAKFTFEDDKTKIHYRDDGLPTFIRYEEDGETYKYEITSRDDYLW